MCMKKDRKTKRNSQRLLKLAIALCFAAGVGLLLWYLAMEGQKRQEAQVQDTLKDLYYTAAPAKEPDSTPVPEVVEVEAVPTDAPAPEPDTAPEDSPRVMAEKFSELYAVNPDVIGWVKAGDQVDGPVVYRDNVYYLHIDFYGNRSSHGTLMLDEVNENFDTDTYRILYGHQFSDGTMFSGLKKYDRLSYLQQYPFVEFHTLYEEEPGQYVIFSVFDASVSKAEGRRYIHLRCFDEWEESAEFRESFLAELQKRSWYEIPVEVSSKDSVLCLVTCSYNDRNGRLMVFARALRPDETTASLTALMAQAKGK